MGWHRAYQNSWKSFFYKQEINYIEVPVSHLSEQTKYFSNLTALKPDPNYSMATPMSLNTKKCDKEDVMPVCK